MKSLLVCLILAATPLLAHADQGTDFATRAAAGRAAAGNTEGTKYDITLFPILTSAGAVCDPAGTKLPASEIGHFELVGDINAQGQMLNIEVAPPTNTAKCFAAQMAKARFASPPLDGRPIYPILIDLNVTQSQ